VNEGGCEVIKRHSLGTLLNPLTSDDPIASSKFHSKWRTKAIAYNLYGIVNLRAINDDYD
jgi:hypothetical protein